MNVLAFLVVAFIGCNVAKTHGRDQARVTTALGGINIYIQNYRKTDG